MEAVIHEYDAAQATPQLLAGIVALRQAVLGHDEPASPIPPYDDVVGELRYGWGTGRRRTLVATVQDEMAADQKPVEVDDDANTHASWVDLAVIPSHRRRGIGTALLLEATRMSRDEGRRLMVAEADHVGPGAEFARRHGAVEALVEARSVCRLADVDPEVLARAAVQGDGYELVRWVGSCPEALLTPFTDLRRAMADAPIDDLDIEPEHWDPAKVRQVERAFAARGVQAYVVAARRVGESELAGMTEAYVSRHSPARSEQGDTVVLRAHRGHGLGLRMKGDMVVWLAAERPDVHELETCNAHTNPWMLAVNAELGYRKTHDWSEWQLEL